MALDIGPGDEVIIPAKSFFATAGVVARLGATPVFVDVDPQTYNVTEALVRPAITERTKAIIPVHLFGQTADLGSLYMRCLRVSGLSLLKMRLKHLAQGYVVGALVTSVSSAARVSSLPKSRWFWRWGRCLWA